MPVQVYGYPCDVDAIDVIAKQNDLKVVYDAAHAFGVECHCGSILNHGDLSVLSFHATKVFNTFEGGAIVSPSSEIKSTIDKLKNFGFENEISVSQMGINGKMDEMRAAFGLLQLQYIDRQIEKRKAIDALYRKELEKTPGIRCHAPSEPKKRNYSYFPIFVDEKYFLTCEQLHEKLKTNGIYSRRYFYPLITDFDVFKENGTGFKNAFQSARHAAQQVLCLPIYPELSRPETKKIIDIIKST